MFKFFRDIAAPTTIANNFNKLYGNLKSLAELIDRGTCTDSQIAAFIIENARYARKEIIDYGQTSNIDMTQKLYIGNISTNRVLLTDAFNVTINPLVMLGEKYNCGEKVRTILFD